MRGAGRSRARWAAGGQGTRSAAAGPRGGGAAAAAAPASPSSDRLVGSSLAGCSPGTSAARARRLRHSPPATSAGRGCASLRACGPRLAVLPPPSARAAAARANSHGASSARPGRATAHAAASPRQRPRGRSPPLSDLSLAPARRPSRSR